ncbi:MAG: hypothetical protein KGJ57_13905 [Sphingomonadales bacterium]|nr:hypothetical protein [Sphingomonadales bacterium]MDE2170498.1 hypothetical protein [Sphingomonadales bacterium]
MTEPNRPATGYLRLFNMLRHWVVACAFLALAAGLLLPVHSDELGWRLQQRFWIDGVDRLAAGQCGAGTLAVPPLFMWPVRWYSAFTNLHAAPPFWVRASGVANACLWVWMVLKLIRRVSRDGSQRHIIAVIACALIGLGCTPLLLVGSRPGQPIILTLTAALLIASGAWQTPGNRFTPFSDMLYATAPAAPGIAWLRSLGIAALAMVALSYHVKALVLMPVFATALLIASRGPRAHGPRLLSLALLVGASLSALNYWSTAPACLPQPTAAQGPWLALSNLNFADYIDRAAPQVFPMADWLAPGRVSWDEVHGWRGGMQVIWSLAAACALLAAGTALWKQARQRVLAIDALMALILLLVTCLWCASQFVRQDYETGFVLPLLVLMVVMGLASPHDLGWLKRFLPVLSLALGSLMLLSLVLVAGLYGPPMITALEADPGITHQPSFAPSPQHSSASSVP